jgi:hypothetical protein
LPRENARGAGDDRAHGCAADAHAFADTPAEHELDAVPAREHGADRHSILPCHELTTWSLVAARLRGGDNSWPLVAAVTLLKRTR